MNCCGSCAHFVNEDIDGLGWCIVYEIETKCAHLCAIYNEKICPDDVGTRVSNGLGIRSACLKLVIESEDCPQEFMEIVTEHFDELV